MLARLAVLIVLGLTVTGCAQWASIYRTPDLDSGASVVTDAKQRIVINMPAPAASKHQGARRVICAEPSPDVAQALSDAVTASLKAQVPRYGNGQVTFNHAAAEAVSQLGERLGTIQLLRDGLYRACEAYANGAIGPAMYAMIVSRMDDTMVTMFTAELAAGAFGRRGAAIAMAAEGSGRTTAGSSSIDPKIALQNVSDAGNRVKIQESQVKAALDELKNLKAKPQPSQEEIKVQQKKVDEADSALKLAQEEHKLALKVFAMSSGAAQTSYAGVPQLMTIGNIASTENAEVGNTLKAIQAAYLKFDHEDARPLMDACFAALSRTITDSATLQSAMIAMDDARRNLRRAQQQMAVQKAAYGGSAHAAATELANAKRVYGQKRDSFRAAAVKAGLTPLGAMCIADFMPEVAIAVGRALDTDGPIGTFNATTSKPKGKGSVSTAAR